MEKNFFDIHEFIHNLKPVTTIPSRTCGVYVIVCLVNNMMYIGSSINIGSRITSHKSALRYNRHDVSIMQEDFNKYGEEQFLFGVIDTYETVPQVIVRIKEQDYVNSIDSKYLYNRTEGIFNDRNIVNLTNEELIAILNFKNDSDSIQDLKNVAEPILLNRFRKNPNEALDYILLKEKNKIIIHKINALSEYLDSTLLNEINRRMTQMSYEINKINMKKQKEAQ